MKLGEIKVQAIALMYPNADVRLDDTDAQSINEAILELKSDPNFEGVLENIVGSVNRCLTYLEIKGLSHTMCCDVPLSLCKRQGERAVIDLPKDCFKADRLLVHRDGRAYICGYEQIGDKIVAHSCGDVFTLVYKSRLERVNRSTDECCELDLPYGVAELIPYYIKGDLYVQENKEEATLSMERFEKYASSLAEIEPPCAECLQIVYSLED